MQVLASHDERHRRFQRRNGTAAGKVPNGTKAADDGEAKASTTRSLRDRLNRPYEERDAELVVELLNVRKKLNFKETASEAADPATQQRSRERIKCYAYLAVWDNRPGSNSSEPICKQTQTCIFHPYQSSLGAPAVHVEMDHPFTIRANDLHVSVEKNGQRTMGIGDKYFLEIKVLPFTSNDMWPPIPILNKSDGSLNPDGTKRVFGSLEGYLVGNYLNLPFAPADAVPLSVAFDQGGRTHKTKYGFEVKSYWRSAPTPLEQRIKVEEPAAAPMSWIPDLQPVDTARQPKRKQKPASEPTKEVRRVAHLSDTVRVKPKTTICYFFEPLLSRIEAERPGFQSCRVEGHWCPSCRTEFQTLRQLQFHLTSNHPKFSFSVEKEELGVDWNRPPRVYIKVEEAEIFRERASDHVKDPREMVWTAPKRPLDVDAYLNGDSRWLGGPLKKRKVVKPISERTKPTNLLAPPIFRLPSQVPDLKPPNRTRNPVPEPKVSQPTPFYASISHQVFEQGEECSESDDEIDQSWLKQKHTAKLQEQRHGWFENDIQRRLRIAFDSHLIDERLPNTRYVSDAFVRFLRKQEDAHWLWTEEGEVEILKLCSEMFEDRVMNEEVFAGIVQMLEERKKHSTSDSSPQITEAALSTMDARTCRQDTFGVCGFCNRYISKKRQLLHCSRETCAHPWRTYHLACAQIKTISREWMCPDCIHDEIVEKAKSDTINNSNISTDSGIAGTIGQDNLGPNGILDVAMGVNSPRDVSMLDASPLALPSNYVGEAATWTPSSGFQPTESEYTTAGSRPTSDNDHKISPSPSNPVARNTAALGDNDRGDEPRIYGTTQPVSRPVPFPSSPINKQSDHRSYSGLPTRGDPGIIDLTGDSDDNTEARPRTTVISNRNHTTSTTQKNTPQLQNGTSHPLSPSRSKGQLMSQPTNISPNSEKRRKGPLIIHLDGAADSSESEDTRATRRREGNLRRSLEAFPLGDLLHHQPNDELTDREEEIGRHPWEGKVFRLDELGPRRISERNRERERRNATTELVSS